MNRSKSPTTLASTGQSPKRRRRAFQIKGRKGWHAEYKYHDGKTQRRTFETETLANDWLDEQVKVDDVASGPLLGGPERVTLGAFLGEYAFRFSIAKQSYESEISRINHYVEAATGTRLVVHRDDKGRRELRQETAPALLPTAFKAHRDARMAAREKTYALIAKLARKRVSDIRTSDIRELMTAGTTEGLG